MKFPLICASPRSILALSIIFNLKRFLLFITSVVLSCGVICQVPDSNHAVRADSTRHIDSASVYTVLDSFSLKPKQDTTWKTDPSVKIGSTAFIQQVLMRHPYFAFNARPYQAPPSAVHKAAGKELLFYVLVMLLILFGLLRQAFPKYFSDMFRLVFRTTLKQRQVREQLIQTPFPALMLNIFFVLVAGFYLNFILQHYHIEPVNNQWLLIVYCAAGILLIYFIKFIGLKFSGWLFNMEQAASSYIFIIFIINKLLGIVLLPFLVLLAFTTGSLYMFSLSLSFAIIGGLLIYRFILTYAAIRNEVKVNPFHFFLYLLAFEIAPLLLVYKGLLLFFTLYS